MPHCFGILLTCLLSGSSQGHPFQHLSVVNGLFCWWDQFPLSSSNQAFSLPWPNMAFLFLIASCLQEDSWGNPQGKLPLRLSKQASFLRRFPRWTLHTGTCPFLWAAHTSESHTMLSVSSSLGVCCDFVVRLLSLNSNKIPKMYHHTPHQDNQRFYDYPHFTDKETQVQVVKYGWLRSLCFGTQNLNFASLTPKSALAQESLGDTWETKPLRELVFSCLMYLSTPHCLFLPFSFSFVF